MRSAIPHGRWRRRAAHFWQKLGPQFVVNVVLFAGLAASGVWWAYPLLWIVPLLTWMMVISRIRNIAEHAVVPDSGDPLRNTRTTRAGFLERLFVAPYYVNYHLEHHLLFYVPCYNLPRAARDPIARALCWADGGAAELCGGAAPGDVEARRGGPARRSSSIRRGARGPERPSTTIRRRRGFRLRAAASPRDQPAAIGAPRRPNVIVRSETSFSRRPGHCARRPGPWPVYNDNWGPAAAHPPR